MGKSELTRETIRRLYYDEDKSQQQIADLFGVSQWVVSDRMRRFDLGTKPKTRALGKRTYDLDETVLDQMTPEVAWVLGWYVADGNINRKTSVFVLKIALRDVDILEHMKKFFGYSGPLLDWKTKLKKTGKIYKGKLLQIASRQLRRKLLDFGIQPGKSSRERYLNCVQGEEYDRQFIKGIFEGDGSLLFYPKGNRYKFQIVGTKELLSETQRRLMKYVGLKETKIHCQNKESNHYLMQYSGSMQVPKIAAWIYKDSQWHLHRKHNTYRKMVRK